LQVDPRLNRNDQRIVYVLGHPGPLSFERCGIGTQQRQLITLVAQDRFVQTLVLSRPRDGSTFTTADLYPPVLDALGLPQSQYSLASLRYHLSKLRAKGLLEKLPHLKLFERIYAPLTAGLLKPFAGDRNLAPDQRCQLDRLYQQLTDDLDALLSAVGLKTAA
jgi:hypothetical protein